MYVPLPYWPFRRGCNVILGVMITRVYALYERRRWVVVLYAAVAMYTIGIGIVSHPIMSSWNSNWHDWTKVGDNQNHKNWKPSCSSHSVGLCEYIGCGQVCNPLLSRQQQLNLYRSRARCMFFLIHRFKRKLIPANRCGSSVVGRARIWYPHIRNDTLQSVVIS